ncbi:MAG: gluconate 2-dehydrogenase subunit 3 family protein [Vicinamibacteraceae bacterium]
MSETRRETLKILGAIGATCAFPFPADELYGQHVHDKAAKPAAPRTELYKPVFFGAVEYQLVSRVADLIIPATDTPGALGAGVPEYVDRVVSLNPEHQGLMRAGLEWIDDRSRELFAERFLGVSEAQQIQMLQPVSDEVDRQQRARLTARYRVGGAGSVFYAPRTEKTDTEQRPIPPVAPPESTLSAADVPVRFFGLLKNLTADGYYTSRVGLLEELGYKGNAALAAFPSCTVPEQ